jgi:hypothetical protein
VREEGGERREGRGAGERGVRGEEGGERSR